MKKGFTLLELVVVIIIISILATLGLINYTKVMEKGRNVEARNNLRLLYKLQTVYYAEKKVYGNASDLIGTGLPYGDYRDYCCGDDDYYFQYQCWGAASGNCYAARCGSGGKSPQGPRYWLRVTPDGVWSEGVTSVCQ